MPHLHDHTVIVNQETQLSLEEIAGRFHKLGEALGERKCLTLRTSAGEVQVKPDDPCHFVLRYERLRRGELKLHIELEWQPDRAGGPTPTEHDVEIM